MELFILILMFIFIILNYVYVCDGEYMQVGTGIH